MKKRSTFGSTFGTVAVVGGSVIGLGNIWRFPYIAGQNGGAAFILIYICVALLISVPIMLSEFSIGRAAQSNSMRAYAKVSGRKGWQAIGYLGIATAFTILSFYSVIAGWGLEFIKESFTGEFMSMDAGQIKANFDAFVGTGWQPILWSTLFIVGTALIVGTGVEKGIERFNKYAMPLMFLILVVMAVNSVTLSGFKEGAAFLLKPDFSKVTIRTVLTAMGQSFFSLSLGMGIMVTYGSYIRTGRNMFGIAGTVTVADTCIAILSGLAIFPAVFSFGINPTSGPDLVFLTLPNIFAQMAGGQVFSVMFFVLLFAASITSSVSLLEVVVAWVHEEFKLKRRAATAVVGFGALCLAVLCCLSQMPDSALRVGSLDIFTFFDKLTSLYMIPVGGFLVVIFAGWIVKKKLMRDEMTTYGRYGTSLFDIVYPLVKFVIPIIIAALFLNELGLFKW